MAESGLTLQNRLVIMFGDRAYFSSMLNIALPMAIQNFIMSSLNLVSIIFIGQLGGTSVAAVGLANQVFFLLQLTLFGVYSGAGIISAQMWGKRDRKGIHNVLGVSLLVGLLVGLLFTCLGGFFSSKILGIYSRDPAVVLIGAGYLRLFSVSFLFVAVTFCYSWILRSTGEVRVPVIVSTSALIFNTVLSYILIFGKLGFPELGVNGAAISGLASRVVECVALLIAVYRLNLTAAAPIRRLFRYNRSFFFKVLKPMIPVTGQEIFWSFGITTYNIIYARISTDAIAAMNIVGTIEMMGMVLFFAIGTSCGVLIGNLIGAEKYDRAQAYAGWSLRLVIVSGVMIGGLLLVFSPFVLVMYKVSPQVIESARRVLFLISGIIWLRASNVILLVGILRGGGDTLFSFFLETGSMWGIGVLAAGIGAFIFGFPVYWVYALAMLDEVTKAIFAIWRFKSKRWIHNLVQVV